MPGQDEVGSVLLQGGQERRSDPRAGAVAAGGERSLVHQHDRPLARVGRQCLAQEGALAAAWMAIEPLIQAGGLVTLLWHNDYFNEPEYADWQWTYEQLLARLAARNPWCATGAEIAAWWRSRVEK